MDSYQKFLSARQSLSSSLKDLENVVKNKIEQVKEEQDVFSGGTDNSQVIISNLNKEINNLQKTLGDIGQENENLVKNFSELRKRGGAVIDVVKNDLGKIKKIINDED